MWNKWLYHSMLIHHLYASGSTIGNWYSVPVYSWWRWRDYNIPLFILHQLLELSMIVFPLSARNIRHISAAYSWRPCSPFFMICFLYKLRTSAPSGIGMSISSTALLPTLMILPFVSLPYYAVYSCCIHVIQNWCDRCFSLYMEYWYGSFVFFPGVCLEYVYKGISMFFCETPPSRGKQWFGICRRRQYDQPS